jgi:hypothetical protein
VRLTVRFGAGNMCYFEGELGVDPDAHLVVGCA